MRRRLAAAAMALASPAAADAVVDDLFLHVLAHEMGHAVIREFDLPVLGPEEALADAFAIVLLHQEMPQDAARITATRARAWLAEDGREGMFSEYPDDAKRAGAAVCLAYGLDPEGRAGLADAFGLAGEAAEACADFGPEQGRAWRRILAPLMMPEGAQVTELGGRMDPGFDPGARPSDAALERAAALLSRIDWHSRVTLALEQGACGAGWSRNGRRIEICDAYLARLAAAAR
jgi:hypothetical protein